MLGFTRLPPWFEGAFAQFEAVFSDSRNIASFTALTSAVMLAEAQRTVSGLTRGISRPDAKSDRTYRYFLGGADWSATDLAHYTATFVFDQLDVGAGDEVLVHVDDTFIGKTGDATNGVAELYNPAEGELEQGNKFVTSCIQVGEVYIPYLARMYVPEDLAPNFEQPFRKKTEIAVEEIVTLLQLPVGAALIVVFDSAYYGDKHVTTIQERGHDVVCRYKLSNHVSPLDEVWSQRVDAFASTLEYEQTTITVRGEKKTYHVASEIVEIEGVGLVKIVASKTDDGTTVLPQHGSRPVSGRDPRTRRVSAEHRDTPPAIGREVRVQTVRSRAETSDRALHPVSVFNVDAGNGVRTSGRGLLGRTRRTERRLDYVKEAYLVETVLDLFEEIDPSLPRAERQAVVHDRVSVLSWSSVANFLITVSEIS